MDSFDEEALGARQCWTVLMKRLWGRVSDGQF